MAKVFIGVPTKNRPDYVQETIESILRQSFQDFRVVVSDNCSNEDAIRRVRNYVNGLRDGRVSYVLQSVDGQEYGQGRFLFGECSEEYFMILHDDDRLEPDHLERALQVLEQDRDISVFGTKQYLIDEDGHRLPKKTVEYSRETKRDQVPEGRVPNMLDYVMGAGVFSISGSVFRSKAVREYGLVDTDCEGLVPFEFNVFLRQAEHGATAYYTTRELVAYRFHGGRQGSYAGHWYWNQQQNETMTKLLERRRFSGSPERWRRRLLGKAYRNYGYIMFVVDRWSDGYRMLLKGLRMDPLRPQAWAYCGFALCCPFLIRPLCKGRVRLLT
jgi:glycosyltransferase involved in cell wall biosynthesis